MKKSGLVKLITTILIGATLLTGCSSGPKSDSTAAATSSAPKKIIVGTGNAYKPYAYLDENNKPVGYAVDLLKEIDKRLPQYTFEIQSMDFTNVLLSLQSGKIDLAAHNYAINAERASKFLYAAQPEKSFKTSSKDANKVAVLKTSKVKSIKDLAGKKVLVAPGSQNAYIVEKYNKEHKDKKLNIVYSSADTVTVLKSLESGQIDATLSSETVIDEQNQTFGDKFKIVGDALYNGGVYYIYRKNETKLRNDVDKVLKELKKDGTIAKLEKKWNFNTK